MIRTHAFVTGALVLVLVAGLAAFPGCSSTNEAAAADCTNALKDGDEVGVDCGGSCTTFCTGAGCATNDECASAKCENGACAAKAGKPCGVGTTVPQCDNAQPCELDKDCKSLTCDGATCAVTPDSPPSAADGKKNNDETDVDCGGTKAPKCADGKGCAGDVDCATGYCPPGTKVCVTPTYTDNVKNGTETDVDCGGLTTSAGFKKCAETKDCLADTDCNGACNYEKKCVDVPSCKTHFGGDTCGPAELTGATKQQDCCRTLPVPGFNDPTRPGKTVHLDKFEITAGRIRAWLASIPGQNVKDWIATNPPAQWHPSWTPFLPTGPGGDTIVVPRKPTNGAEQPPYSRNVGTDYQFNQQLFVYTHGHKCNNVPSGMPSGPSFGMNTFLYPAAVQTLNGGVARTDPFIDGGGKMPIQDALDMKSMTCITSVMLQAFCAWDGGQLASDEVLDFVTGTAPNSGSVATCGGAVGNRCAVATSINASNDSGIIDPKNYSYPFFDASGFDGTDVVMAPGRKLRAGAAVGQAFDTVRINAADEPWMDLHGNMHEIALDTTNGAINALASGQNSFHVKYKGIGFGSARNGGNSVAANLSFPEYRAGYSGGRCMRFK